jgi:hypothetical protein
MIYLWGHLPLVMNDLEALNTSFILAVAALGWSSNIPDLASPIRQCSSRTALWY